MPRVHDYPTYGVPNPPEKRSAIEAAANEILTEGIPDGWQESAILWEEVQECLSGLPSEEVIVLQQTYYAKLMAEALALAAHRLAGSNIIQEMLDLPRP